MADPATGKPLWSESTTPRTADGWTPAGCNAQTPVGVHTNGDTNTPPYDLETLSTDLRRVVAGKSGEVGWIDLATAAVTDVSKMSPSPTPSFGQTPPSDKHALFDPKDDSFWFERDSAETATVMRVAAGSSHADVVAQLGQNADSDWAISATGALVDFGALSNSFGQSCGACGSLQRAPHAIAVNPSGGAALVCDTEPCQLLSPLAGQWQAANLSGSDLSSWQVPPPVGAGFVYFQLPAGWVNDSTLVATPANGPVDSATSSAGSVSLSIKTLIPTPGNTAPKNFVLSPDGRTLAFVGSGSTGPSLYRLDLAAASQQPSEIGPATGSLLAWR